MRAVVGFAAINGFLHRLKMFADVGEIFAGVESGLLEMIEEPLLS